MPTKQCNKCGETKSTSEFYKKESMKDGLRGECKACHAERAKKTYEGRKEEHLLVAYRCTLRKAYGLTEQDYHDMFDKQKGKCLVCEKGLSNKFKKTPGENVHVDHCHDTGKVRGLLCHKCNSGLGLFHDNPEFLEAAAEYIRNARNKL